MTDATGRDKIDWGQVAERALRVAPIGRRFHMPVVDIVALSSFTGSPNSLAVWIVVSDELERRKHQQMEPAIGEFVRELLRAAGYPAEALSSAMVGLASQEAIDRAGGWYNYFR